jgi:hypothetical protein
MLTVIREELTKHLLELPEITNLYVLQDPDFEVQTVGWLVMVEKTLSRFRNPSVSLAAAQKGRIMSARDGYVEPEFSGKKVNTRKVTRATALLALTQAESAIRQEVEKINMEIEPSRVKMTQLLSVASSIKPIPMPPTEPRTEWLKKVWNALSVSEDGTDTRALHTYLGVALHTVDRLYLLDDLLTNLISSSHEGGQQ